MQQPGSAFEVVSIFLSFFPIPTGLSVPNFDLMEAVAAVGVAAAAVQFFEVAAKALKTCSEIRQSAKGESKSNEELGKYVQDLQQIQSSLKAPLPGSDPQTNLVAGIRQECGEIAKELLLRLGKVQQHGRKGWRTSMQATFRTMTESKNIKELERRYQACQRKFQEVLSIEMRHAVADVLRTQGKTNDNLLSIVLPEIHTRFDQVQDSLAHKALLDSLYFPDMFARHRNIAPPSEGTYEWIFDQDAEKDKEMRAKLGQLKRWLSSNEPYFWINGKAGSGKSSLMSFIESDKRTQDELKIWSGSHELYIFSFFFWRPGTDLQKSITGLLQSLLYQLVKKKPAAMGGLVSSGGTLMHSVWTETNLLRAIARVLPMYRHDRLFFLVDGLDEFEGQYLRLLDTLFKLQTGMNIKLCLSSRPETALVKRLASFPSIRLQDINSRDINHFVKQSLGPYQSQGTTDEDIIFTVESRSEGIFLWAVLVCKSLVSGYEAGDDEGTIRRRLNATPTGLESLFSYMFSNIEDVHRESLSVYFSLLKWNVASVAIATVLLHKTPFETLQQYGTECPLMQHRILAQSKGLIELGNFADPVDSRWALLHISTGQKRTEPVLESEYDDLTRYDTIALQWIHRSAYDCLLNSPSGGLAVSLRPDDETRLARETLAAVVWLSKHIPHVVVESGRLNTGLWKAVTDMSSLFDIPGGDLGDDTIQGLDELFAAIMSSLYTEDGASLCQPLSGLLDEADQKNGTQLPLWQFWAGMAGFPDVDRFILPRLEQLERSAYPHRPISVFLMWISQSHKGPWNQLPAVWHRAVDFLTRQAGRQSRAASIESLDGTGELRSHMLSFLEIGTGKAHYFIASALDAMCSTIQEGIDDTGWEAVTKLLKVCEAWDIYHGEPTADKPGYLSPLQMQVPQLYANAYLVNAPEPFKSQRRQRTLRLLCLDPKQMAEANGSWERLKVTASFELSEHCSQAMGDLVVDDLSPFGGFAESMGQERCLQLILNDIWEDPDGQLDAWQRLYIRAYVRKWFKYLWVRRAGK
jgi:hypothetical protein